MTGEVARRELKKSNFEGREMHRVVINEMGSKKRVVNGRESRVPDDEEEGKRA